MTRPLTRLKTTLEAAARGHGFDDKLEKPLEPAREPGSPRPILKLRLVEGTDGDALALLRLELGAALADAPAMKLTRQTFWRALWAALNSARLVPTQDRALDELVLLETTEPVRARAAVKAGLGAVVTELFQAHPEATLESGSGRLAVVLEAREGCLEKAIDLATRAIRAVEAARIRPVEKDSVVRCGFCHADLVQGDLLVQCDKCAAAVHSSCWQDHEGCPAMGCTGAAR